MEPFASCARYGRVRFATSLLPCHRRFGRGKTIVRVVPTKPSPQRQAIAGQAFGRQSLRRQNPRPANAERSPSEREGTPVPDSKAELPPVIRRTEVVAFALVGLLIICIIAVLYVAKAFFLPVMMAFIVGTMLSPAAGFLERYRDSARGRRGADRDRGRRRGHLHGRPDRLARDGMEQQLPELGSLLKEKLHVFDRPLALWQELQSMLGGSDALATFQMPKFDWVQPTLEFLSPTFAEFLLFFATLILFIASWRDLRRALIMTFGDRPARLRTLRILNEIEEHLGGYLLDGDDDQSRRRRRHRPHLRGDGHAQSGRPRRAGRDLEFHPDHRPGRDVRHPGRGRHRRLPDDRRRTAGAALFAAMTFLEGHFITPAIVGRRLELNALAVFIALAFWTWLWGPMGAFLSSPLLIVALIVKEHLMPVIRRNFRRIERLRIGNFPPTGRLFRR